MNIQQTYQIPTIMTWLMIFKIEMECGVYNFCCWFVLIFRTFCVFLINEKCGYFRIHMYKPMWSENEWSKDTKTYMLHQALIYIGRAYKTSLLCQWEYSTPTFINMHINCSSWDKSTTLKYSYTKIVDYKLEFSNK